MATNKIDKLPLYIGLAVTLFGWGTTWGILSSRVGNQAEDIAELKVELKEERDKNVQQEIKISLNADGITDLSDITWTISGVSRSTEDSE